MRWTKMMALPLVVGTFFLAVVFVSPLLFPHILHTITPVWMQHLRQKLLPDGTDTIAQPYTWAMFAVMFALIIVAFLDTAFRQYAPFGSARHASRREARRFRVSRDTSWVVRASLSLLRAPLLLAINTAWMVDTTRINTRLQRPGRESRFMTGTFRGRLIGLNEHDQEEHREAGHHLPPPERGVAVLHGVGVVAERAVLPVVDRELSQRQHGVHDEQR